MTPVTTADVERVASGFHEDPAQSMSLRAEAYTDAPWLEVDTKAIFARSWQWICHVEELTAPGSYVSATVAGMPIVVVRDRRDDLRAFYNVCKHRAHELVVGSGTTRNLVCPYHAWTYDLDGSLRNAPRGGREPGFDPSGFSLLPVAVGTWGPFVFVNPDPDAAPLEDTLGDVASIVAESGLRLDELRFHSHHEWPVESNWKVALENFLECYHCPTAHPGFSKVIDVAPDAYRLRVHPTFSSQVGAVRPAALAGNGAAYTPRGEVTQAQYHFLFPATTINIAPGIANLSIERWIPDGTKRTIEVTDYFFGPGIPDGEIDELLAWDTQVAEEDVALVEAVQRGLGSRMVEQGRLMTASEQLIADFQRRVRDALSAG